MLLFTPSNLDANKHSTIQYLLHSYTRPDTKCLTGLRMFLTQLTLYFCLKHVYLEAHWLGNRALIMALNGCPYKHLYFLLKGKKNWSLLHKIMHEKKSKDHPPLLLHTLSNTMYLFLQFPKIHSILSKQLAEKT